MEGDIGNEVEAVEESISDAPMEPVKPVLVRKKKKYPMPGKKS